MKNATISPSIVIDTNVFLSAIVFGGQPRKLINLIADDALTLVTAEELVTELRRVITSKFPEFIADLKKIEKLLESDATWVRLGGVTIAVSRDSDDDKFIEVAVLGNCHYIISGDKDLLDIKLYDSVKIVSVSEFLEDCNSR
ncbi:putative toxin-antitoxin system toxin component, PIN family [Patescibacteria group bacterium]|nr:putative toxin-antitoxin system toxin component, PIN family [Patescibacteria group bacterium]